MKNIFKKEKSPYASGLPENYSLNPLLEGLYLALACAAVLLVFLYYYAGLPLAAVSFVLTSLRLGKSRSALAYTAFGASIAALAVGLFILIVNVAVFHTL
jgi:hypothetical protein